MPEVEIKSKESQALEMAGDLINSFRREANTQEGDLLLKERDSRKEMVAKMIAIGPELVENDLEKRRAYALEMTEKEIKNCRERVFYSARNLNQNKPWDEFVGLERAERKLITDLLHTEEIGSILQAIGFCKAIASMSVPQSVA